MQKQQITLISGIVLALIAVFMTKNYIDQQRRLVQEQISKDQTVVLVAKQDIARGVIIEPRMLKTEIFPNQYVQPQAASSLDRIDGMVTVASIAKGEQITLTKLTYASQSGNLAQSTPVGKRAITVSVDNISALVGMIQPGDYVDVIAMVPIPVETPDGKQTVQSAVIPLFQNVLVLAVGQTTAMPKAENRYKKEEKKEASPLITLALNPQEANLIVFVQEQGRIRLVLRSPSDSQVQPMQPASWDTLFQYVMPQLMQQKEIPVAQPKKKEESTEPEQIEVYRGLQKENVSVK